MDMRDAVSCEKSLIHLFRNSNLTLKELEKAGGFISRKLYEESFPTLHTEAYFSQRMNAYFDNCEIITAGEYQVDLGKMKEYRKKRIPVGYVRASEVLPVGTPVMIRTLEGDIDMTVEPDLIIMIGVKGEVYPNREKKFRMNYQILPERYSIDKCTLKTCYVPTIRNREDGSVKVLTDYAGTCVSGGEK